MGKAGTDGGLELEGCLIFEERRECFVWELG